MMATRHCGIVESNHCGIERLPTEVKAFFTESAGQSLLVNGAPGTGKTSFTLRVLDTLADGPDEALYVSSRVDKDAIQRLYLDQYSALDRTNVLDLSRDPFETPMDVEFPFDDLSLDTFLDWVRTVSDVSHGLALAFDSWELIEESLSTGDRSDIDDRVLVDRVAALARQEGIDLLLVIEDETAPRLEYIADGFVRLQAERRDTGQTVRRLILEKLRGVHIGNRSKPFTLAEGCYRSYSTVRLRAIRAGSGDDQWVPTPDTKSTFATGIETLDGLLSDGYNRGSVVHVELGPDLPRDAWALVALPTVRNFLAQERGVAVVPPRESSPGLFHGDLSAAVSPEVFERYCVVFDTSTRMETRAEETATNSQRSGGWNGANDQSSNAQGSGRRRQRNGIDGRGLEYSVYLTEVERIRPPDDGPVLHAFSADAMDPEIESRLGDFAHYVALHNDLALLVTKPGSDFRARIDRVADVHLRLERQGETITLSGQNPVTPLLGVGIDIQGQIPRTVLLEMV